MRRRLLIITKEPEFDLRGEVVLGQCEPFTSGWSLILVNPDNKRETLLTGTYTDLRRIQESCSSLEEAAVIRKRVSDMRTLLLSSVTETLAVHMRREPQVEMGETREMESVTDVPKQTPGGLLNLALNGSVLVATIAQPDRSEDSNYLKDELASMMKCHPRTVVMDLGPMANMSPGVFKEIAGVRDRLRENGGVLALCNVAQPVREKLMTLKARDAMPIYENQASAVQALK
jgi:hypothetical protein